MKPILLLTTALAILTAVAASAGVPSPSIRTAQNSIRELAASNDNDDTDPEDMETALAAEQARQEAMEAVAKQINAPLAVFSSIVDRTLDEREAKAHSLLDTILRPACNLSAVESLRGEFISSSTLKAGKVEITSAQADLIDKATPTKVTFLSAAPPDPTSKVLQALSTSAAKIKAINAEYSSYCTSSAEEISKLPVTEHAKVMKVASERQAMEVLRSAQIRLVVEDLNKEVAILDAALVDWALRPLKTAQTK